MYDLYVPVIEGAAEFKYEYEKAFDTVLKGLAPMGDEYVAMLKKAHDERWIDVEETEGKRGGAYMMGVYGVHPYVLLNHSLTTHSVFTIAHELGHAMHSYYSQATQPYIKSDYAIFVAEVASTVNEVMLLKYLVETTEDIPTKKYLLTYYLDMFRTTVYRQTMFAEFEKKAHDYDMKGKPLTPDTLNSIYYRLNKQYYGPGVKHDALIRYEWARIPHFYTAFYVYKYATGLISAVSIARGILQDKNNFAAYKKFLSAGGSDSPYEILKLAGVDLMTDAPYEAAAREFSETLAALESL
jgi:oligoendopeptidase F